MNSGRSFFGGGLGGALRSLEDGLGGEHGAVDLQDLLLLDEVLPPRLQDVVLQGAAHRPKVVQAAHTSNKTSKWDVHDYYFYSSPY